MPKFCVVACGLRSSYVVTEDCPFLVYGILVDTDVSEKYFVGYAAVFWWVGRYVSGKLASVFRVDAPLWEREKN
jgi:hypothetical protein